MNCVNIDPLRVALSLIVNVQNLAGAPRVHRYPASAAFAVISGAPVVCPFSSWHSSIGRAPFS